VFLAGALASLAILVITERINGVTFGLSVPSADRLLDCPDLLRAELHPRHGVAVRREAALADLQRSGHTVGTIYAASTIGSLIGTFVTGFWLISWLGTRTIVWLVAGTLLATGVLIGALPLGRKSRAAAQ
jgi:hypothetical protein